MMKKLNWLASWKQPRMVWNDKFNALSVYNSEVARGIMHEKEYCEKMNALQIEYGVVLKKFAEHNNIQLF